MSDEKSLEEKVEKPKKKRAAKKKTSSKKSTKKTTKTASPKKTKAAPAPKPEPVREKPERSHLKFETKHEIERGGSKGILFALVLAIVVVIIAGGWYQTQQLNKSNQSATVNLDQKINNEVDALKNKLQSLTQELESQKEQEEAETPELLTFNNPNIGLTFQYPKQLGSATAETITNDDETPQDDILRVTFSANPDIWVNFAGSEYTGEEPFVYNGSDLIVSDLCPSPLEVSEEGYCDTKQLAGQETVEIVSRVGETDILNIVKSVRLSIIGPQYSGVTVNLGLGLPPVTGRSLFAPTDTDIQQEALLNFYRNIIKQEQLSLVVRENLDFYETILETMVIQ